MFDMCDLLKSSFLSTRKLAYGVSLFFFLPAVFPARLEDLVLSFWFLSRSILRCFSVFGLLLWLLFFSVFVLLVVDVSCLFLERGLEGRNS